MSIPVTSPAGESKASLDCGALLYMASEISQIGCAVSDPLMHGSGIYPSCVSPDHFGAILIPVLYVLLILLIMNKIHLLHDKFSYDNTLRFKHCG